MMCSTRTLIERRRRLQCPDHPDDVFNLDQHRRTTQPFDPSPSSKRQDSPPHTTLGWRPLIWPPIKWKLSTTSLYCSLVIFAWIFPLATCGAQTVLPPPYSESFRNTAQGEIQGYVRELFPGKFVEYYLGVPYASPPIGDLRFANPVEPEPWNETLVTNKHPPACMQKDKDYIRKHRVDFDSYDEDCLYLNVYVPRTTKKELLPVFAFVHGGSNIAGMAAMHDGDVFASHTDIVVVMMNYRLAAFGFLTLADPELPGNYGLMDQLFSLQWIQKNIEFFGGDKTKVTVSGHSAGAGDVGIHTLSTLAKGLFRYAICQSGSSTAHWAILKPQMNMMNHVKQYIKRMECLKENMHETKLCLRTKSANIIADTWMEPPPNGYNFFAIDYRFLPDTPENLLARAPLNAETMMMGITKDEGTVAGLQLGDHFDTKYFVRLVVQNKGGFPHVPNIDDLIIHEYMQWENPHPESNVSAKMSLSQLFGDYSLTYPTYQCTEILAKRKFPVYFYSFFHRSSEDTTPDWVGVPHGEDIFYLFGSPLVGHPLRNYTDLDKEVSKKLMEFFGNFVKTGKAFLGKKEFKHYTTEEKLLIKFHSANNTALVSHDTNHLPRRMAFWDTLVPSLRRKTTTKMKVQAEQDAKQARKLFIYQILTAFFVSLCLVLMLATGFMLLVIYRRRRDIFSVPTTALVVPPAAQNTPAATTVETETVVVDSKQDTTATLVSSNEANNQQTNTELPPTNH